MKTNARTQVSHLILSTVAALCFLVGCAPEKTPEFSLNTGGISGNYQTVGHAIARTVNQQQTDFRLVDNTSAGSVDNINAVLSGNSNFGIAQADHQYQALKGQAEWQQRGPQTDLRAVFSLYPEAVTLIAGGNAGISTMAQLEGRRVDIGIEGSGTRQNAIDALTAAGFDWQTDIDAHEEALEDRLAMLMHNELDAFFYTVGHPNTDIKFATYSVRGARFVPLENIDSLLANNPYYSRTIIPADLYPRAYNAEDVPTVAVKATLVTSASVPDDAVYAVTRIVFENLEALADYRPVLSRVTRESMLEGLTAPIHPGARRYFVENGLDVPDSDD
jgi:TRAP transporter TAXI family solute receptor